MNPLVSCDWLAESRNDSDLVIVDTRWVNGDFEGGRRAYSQGHIPGAVFLDLDEDLSDRSDLTRGRHPLPAPTDFTAKLAGVGIGKGIRVVAYDDALGSVAARLWWMLEWLGDKNCAILDGGLQKWISEGYPLEAGTNTRQPHQNAFDAHALAGSMVTMEEVERAITTGSAQLVDARAAERYRGEVEPIDRRAGHIPKALNVPFSENMTNDEVPVFKPPLELEKIYRDAGISKDSEIIAYCGSGVTACHDLLALRLAGFPNLRLYPGSWSEWIEKHDS